MIELPSARPARTNSSPIRAVESTPHLSTARGYCEQIDLAGFCPQSLRDCSAVKNLRVCRPPPSRSVGLDWPHSGACGSAHDDGDQWIGGEAHSKTLDR